MNGHDGDASLWSGMLAHLRAHHPELCRQWFEDIEPMGIDSGVLLLRAHSNIHADYLKRQCSDHFNDAARTVSQRLLSVRFLGPEDRPSAAETPGVGAERSNGHAVEVKPSGARDRSGADAHSLVLNPDYTFEHFVVGPGNRLAHAAAKAVSDNPGRAYNPYFVHGDVGLGKTHLLQAVCLQLKERDPGTRIYFTSCEGFITQFMEAVQAGEMGDFRHTFRDVDVLVIDDVHFLAKRDRSQEEFFHTFNALYQAHKQIILSSDAPPEDIPDLEERLVSRFKWGLVTTVAPPCFETRVAILRNKARLRGFDLSDDVACYIASRIDTNIRELEGSIVKVHVLSTVDDREIDTELAREALGDEPEQTETQVQIQSIIGVVTGYYGVRLADLQSKRRQQSIVLPRQICMYLARKHTRFSLEEIGGYFGGRDHTTVMHAVKQIESRAETDAEFGRTIQALERDLLTAATSGS